MQTHARGIIRSRELRRNSTPQERMLWSIIRNGQLGVRFRRQHPVGPYILDFYCHTHDLAVEIDGYQHADCAEQDRERTQYLKQVHGITVIRFTNADINMNREGVLLEIRARLHPAEE